MKSLVLQIGAILAVFWALLVALGSGMGSLELGIWAIAQGALIVFAILRYRRASGESNTRI
ncbi:hypothetical protein [Streptomyces huasconensis]|uniref:hypothetical protein n=1 Tax=Streptomyces huasconensis TaxID=1854574 RepID=UPI00340E9E27